MKQQNIAQEEVAVPTQTGKPEEKPVVTEKPSEIEKKEEVTTEKKAKERRVRVRGPSKLPDIILDKLEDYDDERFLTIHFSPEILKKAPRWKRSARIAKVVREYILRYVKYTVSKSEGGKRMRILEPRVWLSPLLNEIIWKNGAKNPPKRVRVRVLIKVEETIKDENDRPKGYKAELRVFPIEHKKLQV